ncbi:class I SAM-dependent methyltransferase [Candidatus Pelagibacter sp.]|uniref:class I SAM-dependent methyltransferase n=1 Tax=Candidatus Pelagibacter sp. TaxID=2024849 RepID=UPI003F85A0E4
MSTNLEKKKYSCRLCKSKKLQIVFSFKKSPIGDDYINRIKKTKLYDLKLQHCKSCNFVQLSNVIDPKIVYGNYIYVTQTSHGLSEHFERLANYLLKKKIIKKNSKILEIGSNDGTLLKFFKKITNKLIAVDPAAHLFVDKKVTNIADHFSNKSAVKIKKKHGKFDTIIANNVLANIDDLDDIFKGIQKIISNDGYLIIETFSLYGLLKNNLIDNIYHEHLSYFTIKSLKRFAKNYGFNLKEIKFLSVKGGSLRYIFQYKKMRDNKKLVRAIRKEEKYTNKIPKEFKKLKLINKLNEIKLNQFLDKQIKKKKVIGGFGASVGTTTMIFNYSVKNKLNYLFDNEKRRFNLFCPGTDIKVLNPNHIKSKKIDVMIIFAWRYAKIILERNKNKFNKFTKFIIPHPKFRILKKNKL